MITFEELKEKVEQLSEDEMDDLREILRKKKEKEILEASREALKEYEEGKTVALKSPEEIKAFFDEVLNDNN